MSTTERVSLAMEAAQGRVPAVLRALKRHYALTDGVIADGVGMKRQSVANRLHGAVQLSPVELAGFAAFFDVPVEIFYMAPDDAIRWVLDNPSPERAWTSRNLCFADSPDFAADPRLAVAG